MTIKAGLQAETIGPRDEKAAQHRLTFAGVHTVLDRSGALFLAEHATLVVSDLHLEKGSGAGAAGRIVPALDSHDTLSRLAFVIETFAPARVICLGDSFHDVGAGGRMAAADLQALTSLCARVSDWVWVNGNHDPCLPAFCEGTVCESFEIEGVVLRHEPPHAASDVPAPHIVGHFHPKVSVSAGRYRVRGPCFSVSDALMILPAFGAYTGGLNCNHPAIVAAHGGAPARHYLLQRGKIWALA